MSNVVPIGSGVLYLFSLTVISSNQPATVVNGWELPHFEEKSYDYGNDRGGGGGGGRQVYYNQQPWKNPPFERRYHPDHGRYPWYNHHFHRGYETPPIEVHHHKNGGKTYLLHRVHRLGEEETLTRRNFDVGPGENGPQSLGENEDRTYGRNVFQAGGRFRKKHGLKGSDRAATNERLKRQGEEEMGNGRALAKGGGHGGKRPSGATGGKGFHRVGNKPKNNPPRRNHTQNVDFVFPDNPIFLPKNNDCGEGTTYCETDDDYPKDYINELLKKEGDRFKAVFGQDSLLEMNITERVYKDERDLCSSSQHIIFPTKAKNKDEKWQFVINQEGYTQGIGVEICINADKPCSMTDGFPLAYQTFCKQKYITRRLLSLNENGGPGMNEFLFPSCCVCILQSVGLGTRTKPRS